MFYIIPWSLTAILYIPILVELYTLRWPMIGYSHAYFIIPISFYLIWKKRELLIPIAAARFRLTCFSLTLLSFGLLLYLYGFRQGFCSIAIFSLIPVSLGMVLYFYGKKAAFNLLFPILLFLLIIPVPVQLLNLVSMPLRTGITLSGDFILTLFDFIVHHQGFHIFFKSYDVYIGARSSGLPLFMDFFCLGLVYTYLLPLSLKSKIKLVLSIIPLTLIANLAAVSIYCLILAFFGPRMITSLLHALIIFLIYVTMVYAFIKYEKNLNENDFN